MSVSRPEVPTVRVLLADDNVPLVRALRQGLQEEGFAIDTAPDGEEADIKCRNNPYDAIILEPRLPKVDGLSLLRRWRADGVTAHVLLVTARTGYRDQVAGLDAGADDYLTKPFEMDVLLARLRALIRRGHRQKDPILRCHDLEIDTAARTARRSGKPIRLTPTEYRFLEFLAFHRGRVVTRRMFWEHLYDEYDENTSNVVDVYIRYLRTKIDKGFDLPLILTRWGEGYMLRGDDPAANGSAPATMLAGSAK
jgi:DNA-binding response OmpR family regulator